MTVTRDSASSIASLALVIVSILCLVQIAAPPRLINDGVDYLLQASSAIDGNGFLVHGVHSMRAPGYPALILVWAKAGIGKSWAIVALNCFLLGIGCWASYLLFQSSFGFSREASQIISLLTLFSFLMVRNVTYPLRDICFLGASVSCLLILSRAEPDSESRRIWLLIAVIPRMFLSIELRTIGFVLIPAFLWASIGGAAGARHIYPVLRQHRFISFIFLLVALVMVGEVLLHSRYMRFNSPMFERKGVLRSVATSIEYQMTVWGEMTANFPASRLPVALGLPLRILGACAIVICLVGIWLKRVRPDSLLVYRSGFACIVFVYPWLDARLWLPVVPFLMGCVLLGLRRMVSPGVLRPFLLVYCSLFCIFGWVALGFSTRVTFAGARFADI